MPQLTATTLRLALIQGGRDSLTNKLGGRTPDLPRGNGVRIECAIFRADPSAATLITDLGNIVSVTMQVRRDTALGTALFDLTIPAAAFTSPGLTWADWDTNVAQHFAFVLTAAHTGQDLAGKDSLAIYIAFEAQPAVGDPFFLGSAKASIFEDGVGSSGAPVVGDPTYLTEVQSDARYAPLTGFPEQRVASVGAVDGPGKYFIDADDRRWVWSPTRAAAGFSQLSFPE